MRVWHRYQWLYLVGFIHPPHGRVAWYPGPQHQPRDLQRRARRLRGRAEGRADKILLTLDGTGWHSSPNLPVHAKEENGRRLAFELNRFRLLLKRVIAQTERRVLNSETVSAGEKVVSIFEPHTDIIVKDGRETLYGHKVFLTGGASGLVLDCVIWDGNPADSTLCTPMLARQKEVYNRAPRQAALDGGFASRENLREAKEMGVEDVCFSKKRGLKVPDTVKHLGLSEAVRLSRGDRRYDLIPEASLWFGPLHPAR